MKNRYVEPTHFQKDSWAVPPSLGCLLGEACNDLQGSSRKAAVPAITEPPRESPTASRVVHLKHGRYVSTQTPLSIWVKASLCSTTAQGLRVLKSHFLISARSRPFCACVTCLVMFFYDVCSVTPPCFLIMGHIWLHL